MVKFVKKTYIIFFSFFIADKDQSHDLADDQLQKSADGEIANYKSEIIEQEMKSDKIQKTQEESIEGSIQELEEKIKSFQDDLCISQGISPFTNIYIYLDFALNSESFTKEHIKSFQNFKHSTNSFSLILVEFKKNPDLDIASMIAFVLLQTELNLLKINKQNVKNTEIKKFIKYADDLKNRIEKSRAKTCPDLQSIGRFINLSYAMPISVQAIEDEGHDNSSLSAQLNSITNELE